MAPKKKTTAKKISPAPKKKAPLQKKAAAKKKLPIERQVPSKKKVAVEKNTPLKKVAQKTVSKPSASVGNSRSSKMNTKRNSSTNYSIYTDTKIQKPLQNPGKDIIKVLIRNSYEAYIFWNILPDTYNKAVDYFSKPTDELELELKLEYSVGNGDKFHRSIRIHPLSQNYFCRFLGPVNYLKAYLLVVNEGKYFTLFDSSHVSLPREKPADFWDEDWLNPEWIEKGYLIKGRDGKYYLSERVSSGELTIIQEGKLIPMGSSGFMGSSNGGSSQSGSSRGGSSL